MMTHVEYIAEIFAKANQLKEKLRRLNQLYGINLKGTNFTDLN